MTFYGFGIHHVLMQPRSKSTNANVSGVAEIHRIQVVGPKSLGASPNLPVFLQEKSFVDFLVDQSCKTWGNVSTKVNAARRTHRDQTSMVSGNLWEALQFGVFGKYP